MRSVSAPGNILLLGEYAVTEEGGLGVALGGGPRATATAFPAEELTITARMGGQHSQWPADPLPLAEAALAVFSRRGVEPERGRVEIDTSAFYRDSRKLGFGSSAAAAVLLTALLLDGRRPSGADAEGETGTENIFPFALEVHRELQEGRGSGYDVAASLFGGTVRFEGGVTPRAERVELPWLPRLYVIPGPDAVRSGSAVGAYNRWKGERPAEAISFLEESNELVRRFLGSGTWSEAAPIVRAARGLGERLGRAIGVESTFRPASGVIREEELGDQMAPGVVKSVGAGAEMGLLFSPCALDEPALESTELCAEERGLVWE